ncbi:MAG: hypothetical protein GJ676_02560 [Rhodobacteraceae bacterium]|nr:hypothetical protein [Paracoccaceae bacterium]
MISVYRNLNVLGLAIVFVGVLLLSVQSAQAEIEPFIGEYTGSAEIVYADGTKKPRDMSVKISESKDGFTVEWVSTSYKSDGRQKSKSYSIDFLPSAREGIYSAAMTRNVFGHAVPLDPMKGEPFVWGRITGDTLTVFSLFLDENGDYELQQFDRTLVEGGLMLDFVVFRDGAALRSLSTLLERQ